MGQWLLTTCWGDIWVSGSLQLVGEAYGAVAPYNLCVCVGRAYTAVLLPGVSYFHLAEEAT